MADEWQEKVNTLRKIVTEKGHQAGGGWNHAWETSLTPWDRGQGPQPALTSSFERDSRTQPFLSLATGSGESALVPGCGRGVDVEYLASRGFDRAVGIDLVQGAVDKAQQWLGSIPKQPWHDNISFLTLDYLSIGSAENNLDGKAKSFVGAFNFVYDYTYVAD